MCGIHGILELNGAPAPIEVLARMAGITRHRGPDDEGAYGDGPVALGMRRLSIIDLEGGHQPLTNEDRTLWLVANGEIYNYRELARELRSRGHRLRTGSDCETLLHLYEEFGDGFLERVNGMFAFALWDCRRRRLVVGRDRVGVKPLYVANDGRRLAFASEAKALLCVPGVTPELDSDALGAYLALGYVPAPLSIFRGIRKLPPATLLTVEDGRVSEQTYWRVPQHVDANVDEATWIAQVRQRLEAAVKAQMVSDVPIGAFLSGGIDSSAVVAFMSAHSNRPIKTYSIGFDGGTAEAFYNELPHARRIATLFGTEHHEIVVRPDVVELIPRLLWHMDEPIADSAFVTTYLVSEFARRDVTVILSGVGGDELFAGYRRYLGNHYHQRFDRLPTGVQRAMTAVGARLPSDRHSPLLNAMRLIRHLAVLYGGRPGPLGVLKLFRRVVSHLAITGGVAVTDSVVQQVIGHGLAARLSARLGEGMVNGLLTARLGLLAIDLTRPLPFHALPRPSLNDLAGNLLRGAADDRAAAAGPDDPSK